MRSTDGASEIFVKDAEVESLGTRVPLFVAAPRSQGKHPGVLVCPEIWGLTGHIKEVVCRFAAQGYVACALEIFSLFSYITSFPPWRFYAGRDYMPEPILNAGVQHV